MVLILLLAWKYLLQAMFFTGLMGCASVIVISWISIFKEGFSDEGD